MRAVAVLAVLLLVPAVAAQGPAPSVTTSSLKVSASLASPTIALGSAATADVTVSLEITNIYCPNGGTGKIHLSAADEPSSLSGLMGTLSATEIPFTVPATSSSTSISVSGPAKLNITVAKSVIPDHDHAFNLTADFANSDLTGTTAPCVAATASGPGVPAAKGSTTLAIKTGPAPVDHNVTTGPDGSTTTTTSTAAKKSPAPTFAVLLALVGAAIVLRRQD
jgi:hypothetical protein